MPDLVRYLHDYYPNYGPEWGSGGIFGLKYHNGVLYYTLAFEGTAFFYDEKGLRNKYRFEKVGHQPVSGGDTYNAVLGIDDYIFFGGWIHAPSNYRGRKNVGSVIDFTNKYSHVHYYDIPNNRVELLWKDSIHDAEKWAGEVSDILYDPHENKLLIARADGHANLGVYELELWNGRASKILDEPALKGTLNLDYACFAIHYFPKGFGGFECVDLIDRRSFKDLFVPSKYSVDEGEVLYPHVGPTASLYGRIFQFVKGGYIVYDPFIYGEKYFVRLFDIPYSQLGPVRVNAKIIGGGILTAYNMFTHSVIHPTNDFEALAKKSTNTIVSPTLIVYLAPPTIKVVGVLGVRITSIESIGDKLVLAYNTMANTSRYDASPYDQGIRGFTVFDTDILNRDPPSFTMVIPSELIRDKTFGGIPLTGYKDPKIMIYSDKPNTLIINEYYAGIPPFKTYSESTNISRGRNMISLKEYSGIVSFKFKEEPSIRDFVVLSME